MNKILKRILITLSTIILLLVGVVAFALIKSEIETGQILDDYSGIFHDPKYKDAVSAEDVPYITQDVSCGYAVIEMMAKWMKNDTITEQSLYDKYGSVVTSTGKSFEEEMNKQFPSYKTTMYRNLKNTELIDKVYDSLASKIPVPFEWAAKKDGEWTLHYSLISELDVANNSITVQNPYGYEEKLKIEDFLDRTSFKAYENMPFILKLGFAFGIFEKNTIFILR